MNSKMLIGWSAVVIGVIAAVSAFVVSSTQVGQGLAFGFAAFIAFFGAMAVLAHNRAPDHWGLVVVGVVMLALPFISGAFNVDRGAAWTCWVAGGLALILGGIGWTQDKAESQDGMSEWGDSQHLRNGWSYGIGRAALAVGVASIVMGVALHSTIAGTAVTIGLGAMIAVVAVWSLLASEPTHDFLLLAVVGFAMFLSPWAAGYAGDTIAWSAWVAGASATALGVVGYLRDERMDFATAVRDDSAERYRAQFR